MRSAEQLLEPLELMEEGSRIIILEKESNRGFPKLNLSRIELIELI